MKARGQIVLEMCENYPGYQQMDNEARDQLFLNMVRVFDKVIIPVLQNGRREVSSSLCDND